MFSLRPMNTPDQAKRTDTGKRRSKPPEPICECENSVALNHLAILGGLGLLAHCAEFGECLSEGSPAKRVGNPPVRALDPRHRITLDARPFSERIGAWLAYPRHYAKVQIGLALCAIPLACFWLAFLMASI